MSDIPTSNEGDEFWHIDPDGDGMAGPFDTIEKAQADAEAILHNYRSYRIDDIKILKVVSVNKTARAYTTTWEPK